MSFITTFGSKQYIVDYGQKFIVDRLTKNNEGDVFEMPLLLAFGQDKGVTSVQVKVLAHQRGEKIKVFKYMRKSNYKRQYGYRHEETLLQVLDPKAENNQGLVEAKIDSETKPKTKVTKNVKENQEQNQEA
jgi:large subunit ribosomal protein L21